MSGSAHATAAARHGGNPILRVIGWISQICGVVAALTSLRPGAVFVVTKLARLSRSVTDSHRIAERIAAAGAALQIDRSVHDPSTAMGKFFFSILATFAEFEADVASQRTKEGLAIARAKGRLNGKPPKLSKRQHLKVLEEFESGNVTAAVYPTRRDLLLAVFTGEDPAFGEIRI